MAKGTKRKKPGVGIDFRRVKSKVGKKLPKAQNDTDVTFKSKAINLPGQSLTEDKTGQAVSQRNLTLQVCMHIHAYWFAWFSLFSLIWHILTWRIDCRSCSTSYHTTASVSARML